MKENETSTLNPAVAWQNDSYLSMGILGFGFFVLLGITSLPSVSNALSWREFSFVQVSFMSKSPPVGGEAFYPKKCTTTNIIKTVLASKLFLGFTPKLSGVCVVKMEGCKGFSPFVAPRQAADWQTETIK